MAVKKIGTVIREARTAAGLTQEQLARKVKNCSASDVSKAERGEKVLTNDQLKQIAKNIAKERGIDLDDFAKQFNIKI